MAPSSETKGVTPEILAMVRQIAIRTRHIVDDRIAGEYHSAFKGTGLDFKELREFILGDDVRNIDWNASARAGCLMVKTYEEERSLTVMLAVDMSRSGFFGSCGRLKVEVAAELCGVLAFAAINNKDNVGLILFSDHVEKVIRPGKGRKHVLRLIRELLTFEAIGTGTDLNEPLQALSRILKRKATIFLVSDFWADNFRTSLSILSRRHDLVAVRTRDPLEQSLPTVGLVRWVDTETGKESLIDTSHARSRDYIQGQLNRWDNALDKLLLSLSVDLIDIDIAKPYVLPMRHFFQRRVGRRRRVMR